MSVKEVKLLSDGYFNIDMGLLVYGKTKYYGKVYKAALKPLLIVCNDEYILVDTGIGILPERVRKFYTLDKSKDLATSLRESGFSVDDISVVISTHLHLDHVGNNALFKNAKFFAQREEIEYSKKPHRFQKQAYLKEYLDRVDYKPISGKKEIVEGVWTIPTPGHTPGHQSILVKGKETYVYCGDVCPLKENYEMRNIVGVLHNPVNALESIDKLKKLGGHPVFSHDNEQMKLKV
ncbi:MAG: N-acyl homoserine lactonase family protein [Methanobacteriota archaeon]|nr:MAG: N-acyl homoserine lactonase family protein [Euryarchaeota archaeon]